MKQFESLPNSEIKVMRLVSELELSLAVNIQHMEDNATTLRLKTKAGLDLKRGACPGASLQMNLNTHTHNGHRHQPLGGFGWGDFQNKCVYS